MKIEYSQDIQRVTALLYGRTKTGKTPLAATAPEPIFLDVEKRMVSVKEKNVARIQIDTWADIKKAVKWLKKVEKTERKFQTIVVDSLSEIAQKRFADHDANEEMAKNKYWRYSETYKDIMWLIDELKSMPHNLICICKQKPTTIEEVEKYRPLFPGQQLGPEIPYHFDLILCLIPYDGDEEEEKEKPEYARNKVLLIKPTENYEGGSPDSLDKTEVLDMSKIFEKVLAGSTSKPKKKKKKKNES